jgi:hypothetical protein
MKPVNDPRHNLLDDLYSPSGLDPGIAAQDVVAWIEEARLARHRRQKRIQLGAAAAVASVVIAIAFRVLLLEPDGSAQKVTAHQPAESDTSAHLLGDEELLGLIETAPAAIARWPDGRRSLLLLVRANHIPDRREAPPSERDSTGAEASLALDEDGTNADPDDSDLLR